MIMDEVDFPSNPQTEEQKPANLEPAADWSSDRGDQSWHVLAEFTLHDQPSSEHFAEQSARAAIEALALLHLPARCLAGLEAAVVRTALNALEHRDRLFPKLPISMCIYAPKLAELQGVEKFTGTSCGWGYFLIQKLTESGSVEAHPLVQLFLYQEGNI